MQLGWETWSCLKVQCRHWSSGVFMEEQSTYELLLAWLGSVTHRTTVIQSSTCLTASLQLSCPILLPCKPESGPITAQLCSQQTCQPESGWCCTCSMSFTHKRAHTLWERRSMIFLSLARHPFLRICLTALHHSGELKQPQRVHGHTHTYANTSPCYCITTHAHAQARVPLPSLPHPHFIMQHELTPPAGTEEMESLSLLLCYSLRWFHLRWKDIWIHRWR